MESSRNNLDEYTSSSWMDCDAPDVHEFRDMDLGSQVILKGTLHSGDAGWLIMTRTSHGWTQRGRGTTRHMNADYLSGERLSQIIETWVPVDFAMAEAIVATNSEVREIWTSDV